MARYCELESRPRKRIALGPPGEREQREFHPERTVAADVFLQRWVYQMNGRNTFNLPPGYVVNRAAAKRAISPKKSGAEMEVSQFNAAACQFRSESAGTAEATLHWVPRDMFHAFRKSARNESFRCVVSDENNVEGILKVLGKRTHQNFRATLLVKTVFHAQRDAC